MISVTISSPAAVVQFVSLMFLLSISIGKETNQNPVRIVPRIYYIKKVCPLAQEVGIVVLFHQDLLRTETLISPA